MVTNHPIAGASIDRNTLLRALNAFDAAKAAKGEGPNPYHGADDIRERNMAFRRALEDVPGQSIGDMHEHLAGISECKESADQDRLRAAKLMTRLGIAGVVLWQVTGLLSTPALSHLSLPVFVLGVVGAFSAVKGFRESSRLQDLNYVQKRSVEKRMDRVLQTWGNILAASQVPPTAAGALATTAS